jgi:hypothetical protein
MRKYVGAYIVTAVIINLWTVIIGYVPTTIMEFVLVLVKPYTIVR